MTRRPPDDAIRLRGVRHNNLKNFDLDIPVGKLTVVTGLSGSGKSSLAFDTLFAEGQRRYIETFSPYARQFFDRMDKPQVDRIEGIPPAIAIEQRNAVRSTRSTVGTMTEICDYLKVIWPHLARLHCRQCDRIVRTEPPQVIWERARDELQLTDRDCLITFDLALSDKLSLADSLALVGRQGYQRLWVQGEIVRLEDAAGRLQSAQRLTVVQDRLKLSAPNRARFVEACEQAYHFGQGKLTLHPVPADGLADTHSAALPFSRGHHCAHCDLDYPEPTPALFSFNHPLGACPACKGFGRIISIDYHLAIPDRSRTLEEGAVRPWMTGTGAECQIDLLKACRKHRVPTDVPFLELSDDHQRWVIEGDPGYIPDDPANSWPKKWYGVKGYFRWLESKAYKMHVRVLLSRYRAYTLCGTCDGKRLKPEALLYRVPSPAGPIALPDFYAFSIAHALAFIERLTVAASPRRNDPLTLALGEVRTRLSYLVDVGLGYLTLDRPTRTLSGGETERVNLTTCLGTRLVNTLFVLDEPSVGLHARDTARLVRILHQLRDTGNTVVVVEHEAAVIRAADQVVDLGPGQGEKGGALVFTGPLPALLRDKASLTGRYLSGSLAIEIPARRPCPFNRQAGGTTAVSSPMMLNEATVDYRASSAAGRKARKARSASAEAAEAPLENSPAILRVLNANRHNLKNLTIEIPLGRLVALTGVSGSGKTTLVREVLLPALQARLSANRQSTASGKASDRLDDAEKDDESPDASVTAARVEGWESLSDVVLVDQSPLGKTPRSNPVVYIGAFEDIRDLFAQTDLAKQRGLGASAFSFNSGVGQCERCRGAGFEKIEMQFLSDIFIRCPECQGRRYREHILEVKLHGPIMTSAAPTAGGKNTTRAERLSSNDAPVRRVVNWSIADLLDATVDDALTFLENYLHLPAGRRALAALQLLRDVGLGYLRLGQPINTLSGGESQRLKLVTHLAQSDFTKREAIPTAGTEAEAPQLNVRNTKAGVAAWLESRQGKGRGAQARGATGAAPELAPKLVPASTADAVLDPESASPPGTLFLFDEPTTGLHFEDVRILLLVFQRIVDAGHSVVVIEHNLDVIKCADWVIDLGPDAGEAGGTVVAFGPPETIARTKGSHTGEYLRQVLG